jgi:hypothetical protein
MPHVPIAARFEHRVAQWPGWRSGGPQGRPQLDFWLRPAEGERLGTTGLPLAADAGERAVFELGEFAPLTLQMTVYTRARPTSSWLQCRVRTRHVASGFYEEDCDIWDQARTLVGQSRQLAVLP